MGLEQVAIKEIVDRAVDNKLDIPEFQREFVWDAQRVRFLAESLYRQYPVGSFLFWDSSDYTQTKGAHGAGSPTWIVDGQQRTTALCLLLGRKPYWWPEVKDWNKALDKFDVLANLLPDDDIVEFSLPNPVRRKDLRWYPIRDVLEVEGVEDLTPLAEKLVKQLSAAEDDESPFQLFAAVHGRMQKIWQVRETTIPIVTIDHEPEDVAEVFARLNQAGTRVREADVVLALAAVQNPGWVREEYLPFATDVEDAGWDLDAGIYIRTITGIGVRRARLKEVPLDFWKPDGMIRTGAWKQAQQAIRAVLRRLGERGLQSDDLLPSNNSLIPLFVFHDRWAEHPDYKFERPYRWFLLANRDGRYGGSAITALNEDIRDLTGAGHPEDALRRLHQRLRIPDTVDREEFLNRYDRAGNRFLRLMVYLTAYEAGARDWVDGTRVGYDKTGSAVVDGYKPHWHHIFPKKVLGTVSTSTDEVNALANITVLNEDTNVKRLAAKPPAHYIDEYGITTEEMRRHSVSLGFAEADDLEAVWDVGRYESFLIERSEELALATNAYLAGLAPGESLVSASSISEASLADDIEETQVAAHAPTTPADPDAGMRWEIAVDRWDEVRDRVHDEVRQVARRRETISYSALVGRVGSFHGPDSHALAEMLGEINELEPRADGGPLLISAVVTHKHDNYPGPGFFTAASHLGMEVPEGDEEQRIFWANQLERVHQAYSRRGDR